MEATTPEWRGDVRETLRQIGVEACVSVRVPPGFNESREIRELVFSRRQLRDPTARLIDDLASEAVGTFLNGLPLEALVRVLGDIRRICAAGSCLAELRERPDTSWCIARHELRRYALMRISGPRPSFGSEEYRALEEADERAAGRGDLLERLDGSARKAARTAVLALLAAQDPGSWVCEASLADLRSLCDGALLITFERLAIEGDPAARADIYRLLRLLRPKTSSPVPSPEIFTGAKRRFFGAFANRVGQWIEDATLATLHGRTKIETIVGNVNAKIRALGFEIEAAKTARTRGETPAFDKAHRLVALEI